MDKKTAEKGEVMQNLIGNLLGTLVAYEHCAGVVNRICHEMKMNGSQFMVLNYIYEKGRSMGDIAFMLGVAKPNATPIVHALEEQGYIERNKDENDGRMMIITETEKGRACHDAIFKEIINVVGSELRMMNLSELRKANNALGLLREIADELLDPKRYKY